MKRRAEAFGQHVRRGAAHAPATPTKPRKKPAAIDPQLLAKNRATGEDEDDRRDFEPGDVPAEVNPRVRSPNAGFVACNTAAAPKRCTLAQNPAVLKTNWSSPVAARQRPSRAASRESVIFCRPTHGKQDRPRYDTRRGETERRQIDEDDLMRTTSSPRSAEQQPDADVQKVEAINGETECSGYPLPTALARGSSGRTEHHLVSSLLPPHRVKIIAAALLRWSAPTLPSHPGAGRLQASPAHRLPRPRARCVASTPNR